MIPLGTSGGVHVTLIIPSTIVSTAFSTGEGTGMLQEYTAIHFCTCVP